MHVTEVFPHHESDCPLVLRKRGSHKRTKAVTWIFHPNFVSLFLCFTPLFALGIQMGRVVRLVVFVLTLFTSTLAWNASNVSVKVLYLSHILVTGIHSNSSIHPVNGTVTIVSPAIINNTIDDTDVMEFISTKDYLRERNTTYKYLLCSFGNVVNGTESACHDSIVLEDESQRQASNDAERVLIRIVQFMYLGDNRRRLTKRALGSTEFDELNAVFNGVVLAIPDQSFEKKIWPSTLKVKISALRCGQVSIGDIQIRSTSSNKAINAGVDLVSLSIVCTADYKYDWGWFGGDGRVSAGGSHQSIRTSLTLNTDGTVTIDSCDSNVDLTHLSFSGGIISRIADTFKSFFRTKLEEVLETTICEELGPLGSSVIQDLAMMIKVESNPYVPVANGGSHVATTQDPLAKENSLLDGIKSSLISWKNTLINPDSTDPLALLVPKAFAAMEEYLGNNETGINHFLEKYVLEKDGSLTINFITLESARGVTLYHGVDPLTSTSFAMSKLVIKGLNQFNTFRPLVVLGDQTLGHKLRMEGTVIASASFSLKIGPSTASDSLIYRHQGHIVEEYPQASISISDLNIDASTFVGVSKDKALSIRIGSIEQAPLPCFSSAFHGMELQDFMATIRDIEEPVLSGFLSSGVDRLFSQALHLVYLKYEDRMKLAMPNFLTTTGRNMTNSLISNYITSHDQTSKTTCPDPQIAYNSGLFVNFRTNKLWNQFQSAALGPFIENNASMLNKLVHDMTDSGSIHDLLGDNYTSKNRTNVETGEGFLGTVEFAAGNVGVHGLNTIHGIELLTATSRHHGTNFAGVESWLSLEHNLSKYLLSTAMALGTGSRPLKGSVDVMFGAQGGQANNFSPILNDFTFTLGISELEALIQVLIKIDHGNLRHLQIRHIVHLDCWISTIGQLMFHQVHAKLKDSLFAGIKCRTCTSPGFRDLQQTLSTEQASKDLKKLVNDIFDFLSNLVESSVVVQMEINKWVSDSTTRCAIASNGFFPDGSYKDVASLNNVETEDDKPVAVVDGKSHATLDYTLFAILGMLIGGMLMCCRVYNKEKHWQRNLLSLDKEIELKNQGKAKEDRQPSPLISAASSLFSSPHVPLFIRIGVPMVLVANGAFFLSGHLSLGALVRVFLNIAGEDVLIPDVFTFSMAQSTIDMWNAGGKFLAIILVIFSGIWPYTKVSITMFLWMAPPTLYAPSSRESAFMWLDGLGKWSIIDIFVLVLSMVGFHLIIKSPVVSFLPPEFWIVEVSVVPVWGLYANLIAQVQSQIISHICIYFHRNSMAAVEEETGHKQLEIKDVKNLLQQRIEHDPMITNPMTSRNCVTKSSPLSTVVELSEEERESSELKVFVDGIATATKKRNRKRGRSTWITSQNNIPGPRRALIHNKASLRTHYFEMKSEDCDPGEIGRLRFQVSPCGQCLVITVIIVTEIILVYGTVMPSFYMDTHGLAGLAIDLGRTNTSYQQYSIVSTVESIANQIDSTDSFSVAGIGAIAGFFFLTTVIIPSLQLLGLLLMWTLSLSLENQKRLFLLNEALSAWQYLEVYIIAIGVATLQMADISNQIAAPLCSDLDGTFDVMASLGMVDRIDANCFTVLAGVENGIYILMVGAIFLNFLNILINRATVAALQDRESRLRGNVSKRRADEPKSFFRDSCIKYLIFSCCCCVRYVAEEYDKDDGSDDESDTAELSSSTCKRVNVSRKRLLTFAGRRSNRTVSVVNVFVPEKKHGLPPHWEKVVSDEGHVYYWHTLTGETQWENPIRGRGSSFFSRVELVDEGTGRVYFWNQLTGSTRWKPDREGSDFVST